MRAPSLSFAVFVLLSACGGRTNDLPAESNDAAIDGTPGAVDGAPGGSDGATPDAATPPSDGTTPLPPPDGATSEVATPPSDAAVPDLGPVADASGLTMSGACDKIAASSCGAGFKACCEASGFKFDAFACGDASRWWCRNQANAVTAGSATFDPAWADACAAGWASGTTLCTPHIFDWIKAMAPCAQLFNGKVAPGGACSVDSDCKAVPGQSVWCEGTGKRCRAAMVVGEGQPCNYFGAAVRFCDKGLTCSTDAAGLSTCAKAIPVGGSCFGPDDSACGLGFVCDVNKCAPGQPPGAACTKDLQCASWSCQSGKCTDVRQFIASKPFCGG